MPNWAVREKLLDKFLVGGKPVPDRVLEVWVGQALSSKRHFQPSSNLLSLPPLGRLEVCCLLPLCSG